MHELTCEHTFAVITVSTVVASVTVITIILDVAITVPATIALDLNLLICART